MASKLYSSLADERGLDGRGTDPSERDIPWSTPSATDSGVLYTPAAPSPSTNLIVELLKSSGIEAQALLDLIRTLNSPPPEYGQGLSQGLQDGITEAVVTCIEDWRKLLHSAGSAADSSLSWLWGLVTLSPEAWKDVQSATAKTLSAVLEIDAAVSWTPEKCDQVAEQLLALSEHADDEVADWLIELASQLMSVAGMRRALEYFASRAPAERRALLEQTVRPFLDMIRGAAADSIRDLAHELVGNRNNPKKLGEIIGRWYGLVLGTVLLTVIGL